jgi:hypothetical protein
MSKELVSFNEYLLVTEPLVDWLVVAVDCRHDRITKSPSPDP